MGTYPQPSDDVNPFGAAAYAANNAASEITNLDQLKEMQLRLLAAQPARIDKRGSLPCQPKLPSNLICNPNVSNSLAQAPMLGDLQGAQCLAPRTGVHCAPLLGTSHKQAGAQ